MPSKESALPYVSPEDHQTTDLTLASQESPLNRQQADKKVKGNESSDGEPLQLILSDMTLTTFAEIPQDIQPADEKVEIVVSNDSDPGPSIQSDEPLQNIGPTTTPPMSPIKSTEVTSPQGVMCFYMIPKEDTKLTVNPPPYVDTQLQAQYSEVCLVTTY